MQHNFEALQDLYTQLQHKFDIISVSETWNSEGKKHQFLTPSLENYHDYLGITGTSLKSGCGMYIRKDIKFVTRSDLDVSFTDDLNEFQCIFIEIISKKCPNIIVGTFYRHPKRGSNNTFNNNLKEIIVKIKSSKNKIFIRDFNYDLFKHTNDCYIQEFITILLSNSMQPVINRSTRILPGARPSLIDNIFTNILEKTYIQVI